MKYWGVTLGLAVLVFFGAFQLTLRYIPIAAMAKTEKRIAKVAGGYNVMYHARRPNANYRGVVRPSPDQLYSACIYDLADGPVVFEGEAPAGSYWSLSFFAHNTDNFYVINDRQIGGRPFRIILVRAGKKPDEKSAGAQIVRSPSRTGIVLQRVFIDRDDQAQALDSQRRRTSCHPLS